MNDPSSESHRVTVVATTPSASSSTTFKKIKKRKTRRRKPVEHSQVPLLPGPLHDDRFINQNISHSGIIIKDPKALVLRATQPHLTTGVTVTCYRTQQLAVIQRVIVVVRGVEPEIVGIGDAEQIAYRSVAYQLYNKGVFDEITIRLSDSTLLTFAVAKRFMEFYCSRFSFSDPEIVSELFPYGWETRMSVLDRKLGPGIGKTRKSSVTRCYLDVVDYIEQCDPALWKIFQNKEDTKISADNCV